MKGGAVAPKDVLNKTGGCNRWENKETRVKIQIKAG